MFVDQTLRILFRNPFFGLLDCLYVELKEYRHATRYYFHLSFWNATRQIAHIRLEQNNIAIVIGDVLLYHLNHIYTHSIEYIILKQNLH